MTRLPADSIVDLLSALVDKSLVVYEEQDGEGRYRLLETVRQYGRERLAEGDRETATRGRHAAWFLALAEEAAPLLRGPEQGVRLARLETEHDNLRIALSWYAQQPDEGEMSLRLAGVIGAFLGNVRAFVGGATVAESGAGTSRGIGNMGIGGSAGARQSTPGGGQSGLGSG